MCSPHPYQVALLQVLHLAAMHILTALSKMFNCVIVEGLRKVVLCRADDEAGRDTLCIQYLVTLCMYCTVCMYVVWTGETSPIDLSGCRWGIRGANVHGIDRGTVLGTGRSTPLGIRRSTAWSTPPQGTARSIGRSTSRSTPQGTLSGFVQILFDTCLTDFDIPWGLEVLTATLVVARVVFATPDSGLVGRCPSLLCLAGFTWLFHRETLVESSHRQAALLCPSICFTFTWSARFTLTWPFHKSWTRSPTVASSTHCHTSHRHTFHLSSRISITFSTNVFHAQPA